ncbi:MAG: TIGR03960 family B12-binding radical SAM protein [Actinobacteria bacterium]|nr:TIGR03960 family B12-binding radical SAM protein [Actinomycetota bacterium]
MTTLWPRIEPLLPRVQKPARYIGLEDGMVVPDHGAHKVSWAVMYPDTYEIGLPNQGIQILCEVLNERDDAVAERAYTPWPDMASQLRSCNVPLFTLETHRAVGDFDVIGFNLAAELVYTNVLESLDLAGVPLRQQDRVDTDPIVVVGGHASFNPEPMADFVDVVALGDGEELVGDISQVLQGWKRSGKPSGSRQRVLRELAQIQGCYIPSLYDVTYEGDHIAAIEPKFSDVPEVVYKRTVADLADWPYPKNQLVPLSEVVHDRLNVEVFRGCTRGCRFCQAGMITRPVRERPAEQVSSLISNGLRRTGYDEVTLTSLSTADFSGIESVVAAAIADPLTCGDTTISLPSLRVDAFTVGLADKVSNARRSGLTFAPEAGTWRMRQIINKLILDEDLYGAVESAYSQGWKRMKLYFLTGLPSEMDEDTTAIADLAANCVEIGKSHNKKASVTVSLGGFVPKAHTPFQWFGQNSAEELSRKIGLVREATRRNPRVNLKWHDAKASVVEGLVSRGDRRLGRVIEHVWRHGGVFQEWGEHFNLDLWHDAMAANGLSMDFYVTRHRREDEILPWQHIHAGLHSDFLWQDWQDSLAGHGIPDCRWTPCYDCGACTEYGVEHVVASPVPPAGGSQGTGQDIAAVQAVDGANWVPVTLGSGPS